MRRALFELRPAVLYCTRLCPVVALLMSAPGREFTTTSFSIRRHPGHHICPSWSSRPHSGSRRTRCLQWKQRLNGGRSRQQLAAVTEEVTPSYAFRCCLVMCSASSNNNSRPARTRVTLFQAVQAQELADWLPEQAARQLTDPLVLRALRALQRRPTHVPRLQRTVQTAFLSTEAQAGKLNKTARELSCLFCFSIAICGRKQQPTVHFFPETGAEQACCMAFSSASRGACCCRHSSIPTTSRL